MPKIIFISGPTAVGKTAFSLHLAKEIFQKRKIECEAINFDSLLFYRELSIGTDRPSVDQLREVVHHLVGTESVESPMNAGRFVKAAEKKIEEMEKKGHLPLLAGGSGFYLRALVKGMVTNKAAPDCLKESIREDYARMGIRPFREYLKENDPLSLQQIHPNDHYRMMRAYEYHRTTGEAFSREKERSELKRPYDFSQGRLSRDFLHLYLDIPKEKHERFIALRVRRMIEEGLIEEVRRLLPLRNAPPLRAVGYREVLAYLDGEISSKDELMEKIRIRTRRLAKAQRTFFKKITPKVRFESAEEGTDLALRFLDQDKNGMVE